MKRVVISTFNNSKNNYGAVFQACALSDFIKSLGYFPYNITIQKRAKSNTNILLCIKRLVKALINFPFRKFEKERTRSFYYFTSQTQNQIIYKNVDVLWANPPEAEVYLSGSDQVWNPINIHEDFFLRYAKSGWKKISYAASMGYEHIPVANIERFSQYISDYDTISVREDTMIEIISQYTNKTVRQNIDPVFLKDKSEWVKMSIPYDRLKFDKFILVYAIEWNQNYNTQLNMLKQQLGVPVVFICIGNIKNICANQVIRDASPNHFLYLLDKADFVVATSFHGIALSIVFNKPFLALPGNDKPTRIQSLLRHFGLSDRTKLACAQQSIDYELINKIIDLDRDAAAVYLTQAIEE